MNELQRSLNNEAWFQLRDGNFAKGAELLSSCIAVRPEIGNQTAPYYRNLALAQLCLGKYLSAEEIQRKLISLLSARHSSDFEIYGCTLWLRGHHNDAVAKWEEGLNCDYADSANVQIPLLLWFGYSWLQRDTSKILELLRRRVGDRKTGIGWPLPIARYLIRNRSVEQLEAEAEMSSHAHIRIRQRRQVQFYIAVEKYLQGETEQFTTTMIEIAATKEMLSECERYLAQNLVTKEGIRGTERAIQSKEIDEQ